MFKAHSFHGRARLAHRLAMLCIFSTLAFTVDATNRNWTGNSGVDNHWTTPGNWQGGVAPVAGDNLIFSGVSMSGTQSNYNSYAPGTVFGQISINQATGQSFVLGGNRIVLTNGITTTGPTLMALAANFYLDITLGANQTFAPQKTMYLRGNLDFNGYSLIINNPSTVNIFGNVTNSVYSYYYPLGKTNAGNLIISSPHFFTTPPPYSALTVEQGALFFNGTATNSVVEMGQGAAVVDGTLYEITSEGTTMMLSGTGTISEITTDTNINPFYLMNVTPGDNGAPGLLSCGLFAPGAGTLNIAINGTTPSSGYSQLVVSSNYTLSGYVFGFFSEVSYCSLVLQGSYVPQLGDSFNVLKLTSGVPYYFQTNACFSNLPPNFIYEMTNGSSLGAIYDTSGLTLKTVHTASSSFALWKGSGSTDLSSYGDLRWSLATNWAGGMAPGTGVPIEFTRYTFTAFSNSPFSTAVPLPPLTNDLPDSTIIPWLLLSGSNYVLCGNPLTITDGITNQALGRIGGIWIWRRAARSRSKLIPAELC